MEHLSSLTKNKYIKNFESEKSIILLHGLFGTLSNWEHVIHYFSGECSIYAPTFPMCRKPKSGGCLNQLVAFLEEYIDQYEIKNPILIGNSLGGHVALLYALKHPTKVEKIVLTGSSGLYENTLGASFIRVRDYNYIQKKVGEVFENKKVITKELVDNVYSSTQNPAEVLRLIGLSRDAQKQNLKEFLHEIKIPVLLIWGEQDLVTPVSVAYEFHQNLSNSTLKLIGDCGHVPMMEQPKLFNQYVAEFILN